MEVGKRGSLIVLQEVHFQQSVPMDGKTKRFRVVSGQMQRIGLARQKTSDTCLYFVYTVNVVFVLFF